MSLFRGLPRLTVLNSYTAVESLANVVYSKCKSEQLTSNGVPESYAQEFAERERKSNRTRFQFLFHRGMSDATGRSLHDEDKEKYDALLTVSELRDQIVHAGVKPREDDARNAHKLCCEVTQWLADVGGYPVKPMLPATEDTLNGLEVASSVPLSTSSAQFSLIKTLMGCDEQQPH